MKLLILTQAVDQDDPVLGFFHRWIEEFAKNCARVHVVCLRAGRHQLPSNVVVHSLGKEHGGNRFLYTVRFYRYTWLLRHEYDAVLVHMNPEYLVLGGWLWRALGKHVGLWFVHKSVRPSLRIGTFFAHVIYTASRESFRLVSDKVQIVGHGIDIPSLPRTVSDTLRLVTIGRIARSKRIVEMIGGVAELTKRGTRATLAIYGTPTTREERVYQEEIQETIVSLEVSHIVQLKGAIPHDHVPQVLAETDVALNFSLTGSMDKAVLEAFAAGVPVVTCNEAYANVPVATHIASTAPEIVASGIERALQSDRAALHAYVDAHHTLPRLVQAVVHGLRAA